MLKFLDEDGLSDKERNEINRILFQSPSDENTTCFFLDDPKSVAALNRYEKAHGLSVVPSHAGVTPLPTSLPFAAVSNAAATQFFVLSAAAAANAHHMRNDALAAAMANAAGYNFVPPGPATQLPSPPGPTTAFCLPPAAASGAGLLYPYPHPAGPFPFYCPTVYLPSHIAATPEMLSVAAQMQPAVSVAPFSSAADVSRINLGVASPPQHTPSLSSTTNFAGACVNLVDDGSAATSDGSEAVDGDGRDDPNVAVSVAYDNGEEGASSTAVVSLSSGGNSIDVVPVDPQPIDRLSTTPTSARGVAADDQDGDVELQAGATLSGHCSFDEKHQVDGFEVDSVGMDEQRSNVFMTTADDAKTADLNVEPTSEQKTPTIQRQANGDDSQFDDKQISFVSDICGAVDVQSSAHVSGTLPSSAPVFEVEKSPQTSQPPISPKVQAATTAQPSTVPKSWASLFKDAPAATSAIVIRKYPSLSFEAGDSSAASSATAMNGERSTSSWQTSETSKGGVVGSGAKASANSQRGICGGLADFVVKLETVDRDPPAQELGKYLKDYKLDHRGPGLPLRGLKNFGNWCYVNATLQALMACPPFVRLLRQLKFMEMRTPSSTPMLDALIKFVGEFSNDKISRKSEDKCSSFEPSYVYSALSSLREDTSFKGRQEDAEEFLGVVLNHLHEETAACLNYWADRSSAQNGEIGKSVGNTVAQLTASEDSAEWQQVGPGRKLPITRTSKLAPSPIAEIFSGVLRNGFMQIQPGAKESVSLESFFTLQLSVQSNEITSIHAAIQQMGKEIILRKDSNKKTEGEIVRRTTFQELPLVLILHLKYFVFADDAVRKHTKQIIYNMDLHIERDFVPHSPKNVPPQRFARTYKLFAVVFHHGENAEGGHYTADIFHAGQWLNMDDSKFEQVDESHVLDYRPPRVPYLLFYRRCDVLSDNRSIAQQQNLQYTSRNQHQQQ